MTILDNLKQKVSDTAKYAAKKSNKVVEITKLNIAISAEEDKIKKIFYDLGKHAYKIFLEGEKVDETFSKDCEKIQEYEKNIEGMKSKINQLKQIKVCESCKAELDEAMQFCFVCGYKQENVEKKDRKVVHLSDELDKNEENDTSEKNNSDL